MICIKLNVIKKIVCAVLCVAVFACPLSAYASQQSSGALASEEKGTKSSEKAFVFEASISELKDMLEKGTITSQEICETYIERINTYDKDGVKLNSIVSINTNAIAQAKQKDNERAAGVAKGILHGIPIVVKDNIDVSGFPTTLGKTSLESAVADADSAAVARLVSEGAIILGKTNMSTDDIATRYTASAILGETRNAFDTAFSAGGSSGGSAVAVSANFAAAALATDTNGSATYPSALNGVVTVRPTHGLIDYTGCSAVAGARDTIAPVAKNVADAALLMDVLTQSGDKMTYSKSLSRDSLKGKTLAVIKELSQYTYNSPNEFKQADKEILQLFDTALEKLKEQGANIVTVSIPKLFTYYYTCRESNSGSESAKAALLSELEGLLSQNNADAFIFPSYLSSPMPSGFDKYGTHKSSSLIYLNCGAYLPSLVGLPAVCVPMGMHSDGVSTGLELVSLPNTDSLLLNLANSYEKYTSNRTAPEQTPNLYTEPQMLPEQNDEQQGVSSQKNLQPQESEQNSSKIQKIAVGVIIAVILALCIWAVIFGRYKDSNKDTHKNRNF